jgi:uncharacterized protein with GYD domain
MTPDQRLAEQVAAMEIVAKFGGENEGQWWLWTDRALLSITSYPDEASGMKALMAIVARGAFELQSQTALSLEEIAGLQAGI